MLSYLIGRWLQLVPTLALASVLVFGIITLAPGDPVRMKIGLEATPQQVTAERERLGLDKPLPMRFAVWLSDVVRLDLGRSLVNSRPVTGLIAEAFPKVTPTPPTEWPDDRFDLVWTFTKTADGWHFAQIPELALPQDQADVIEN